MTNEQLAEARAQWDAFEAGCSGLIANRCRRHLPYMGCATTCEDVENAIGEEWKAARLAVEALFDEIERLRDRIATMQQTRDQSCSCAIANGSAPLVSHHKDCALRVNLRKRIDPALALSRLATALDSEGETAEEIAAWLTSIACAPANELVDQTDPNCPVGVMLTRIADDIRAGKWKK